MIEIISKNEISKFAKRKNEKKNQSFKEISRLSNLHQNEIVETIFDKKI